MYIENGQTRLHTYFESPFKIVIEELEPDIVLPELNRRKPSKREGNLVKEKQDHVVESLI